MNDGGGKGDGSGNGESFLILALVGFLHFLWSSSLHEKRTGHKNYDCIRSLRVASLGVAKLLKGDSNNIGEW